MVRGMGEHPAQTALRGTLSGPFAKTAPLRDAVEALVKGIQRRARIVTHPRWVRYLLPVRGLIQRVAERDPKKVMPQIEQLFERELAEKGTGASAPVGAGGAAAVEAGSPERV